MKLAICFTWNRALWQHNILDVYTCTNGSFVFKVKYASLYYKYTKLIFQRNVYKPTVEDKRFITELRTQGTKTNSFTPLSINSQSRADNSYFFLSQEQTTLAFFLNQEQTTLTFFSPLVVVHDIHPKLNVIPGENFPGGALLTPAAEALVVDEGSITALGVFQVKLQKDKSS